MSVIYRDKITPTRILVPIDKQKPGRGALSDKNNWSIECVEVNDFRGIGWLSARKTFMPVVVLERYYKKEEL